MIHPTASTSSPCPGRIAIGEAVIGTLPKPKREPLVRQKADVGAARTTRSFTLRRKSNALKEAVSATAPRKKHAGIVAGKLVGSALMEELFKSLRRTRVRGEYSVTAPSKKHAGIVERSRRTVGAASTDGLCRVARPIAKPEAVAASVLEKRRSGIVAAEEQRRRHGRVILRPNVVRVRTFPLRMVQGREAPKPTHVLPQRHLGDKVYA